LDRKFGQFTKGKWAQKSRFCSSRDHIISESGTF
jgi:hypothetical protein